MGSTSIGTEIPLITVTSYQSDGVPGLSIVASNWVAGGFPPIPAGQVMLALQSPVAHAGMLGLHAATTHWPLTLEAHSHALLQQALLGLPMSDNGQLPPPGVQAPSNFESGHPERPKIAPLHCIACAVELAAGVGAGRQSLAVFAPLLGAFNSILPALGFGKLLKQ